MAEGSRLDLSPHQVGRIHFLCVASPHPARYARRPLLKGEAPAQLLTVRRALARRPIGPGGESGVAPPVPIPNTEVKRSSAHDTRVTKPWENRPVPGPFGRRANAGAPTQRLGILGVAARC